MRILVDATPARFGGLATYVQGLSGAWRSVAAADELHVLLGATSPVSVPSNGTVLVHRITIGRPSLLGAPLAQSFVVPRLAREVAADIVLSVIPTVPLRPVPVPITIVVHDLRHELLPHQFSLRQHVLRRLAYGTAYRRSASVICVSDRTRSDLLRLHPGMKTRPWAVVPHGADHVDTWPREPPGGHALAFGHTNNKRPELVLDTWAELATMARNPPPVHVVGLGDRARRALQTAAAARGLGGLVIAHAFLPEKDFRRLLTSALLVVYPSDFEGFGLPVLEAMKLGMPVVVGPDPAVAEVAGGHAFAAQDLRPSSLAGAVVQALGTTEPQRAAARLHAASYTWAASVRRTRQLLLGTLDRGQG